MWDNFEKLNYCASKTARLAIEISFFRDFTVKSSNFREGHQKGRGCFFSRGGGGGGDNRQRYATDPSS